MHMKIKIWIKAFRLRTLPLAMSCSILGSFLAFAQDNFRWIVFILAILTTLFLQILSNLANDYGDTIHGTDNENRIGPDRVTQKGWVTKNQMLSVIIIFALFAFLSGSLLIFIGLKSTLQVILFYCLGLASIFAAIKYTVGKNPYGYIGFGDLFVFLFFGIVGVAGTFYLHTNAFDPWIILLSSALGLLSSAVLNLNNMRDIENDTLSGKKTLVVRIGAKAAKFYHVGLITTSMALSIVYTFMFFDSAYQLLFLITFPLFFLDIKTVLQNTKPIELNGELKKLALSTFAFSFTFGLGYMLS
jgi:1,4-dihydroxy-2-naphthoate polyprenyltransferase